MKIAIFSNVKDDLEAFEAFIEDTKKEKVDSFAYLGDLSTQENKSIRCFELMKELNPFCWLKGDMDSVKDLPMESSWQIKGFSIKCVHGSPRMINETIDSSTDIEELKGIVESVEEDIILCGHSSEAFQCEINQKRIINVGSITSINGIFGTYFILDIEDKLNIQQKRFRQ